MNTFDIDRTAEFVKNIVDKNRCPLCDRADGLRLRYACGHTACDNCVVTAEDCLTCLTPPTCNLNIVDKELTNRVKNVSTLLKSYQRLCNIDVYKRQRLSEQLKIEKELFPQCIQAPAKYENKHKRSTRYSEDKENKRISYFPGENISPLKEDNMDKSVNYVQQWLNKNDRNFARKPFTDLNSNQPYINEAKSTKVVPLKNNNFENFNAFTPRNKTNLKRSHYKTIKKHKINSDENVSRIGSHKKPKKSRMSLILLDNNITHTEIEKKKDDESGIVIDDEPIVIEDSQTTINDKDKEAWLAVIEASKKDDFEFKTLRSDFSELSQTYEESQHPFRLSQQSETKNQLLKVPFYKKSYLTEICHNCKTEANVPEKPKEVTITIETDSFSTTIKVNKNAKVNDDNSKTSVAVQTNISENLQSAFKLGTAEAVTQVQGTGLKKENDDFKIIQCTYDTQDRDIFTAVENTFENIPQEAYKEKAALVIEESDSDDGIVNSGPMHVTVDIHRSSDIDNEVLAEVDNEEAHCARPRHPPRGHTPTSTDSSEKENYDPNRQRRNRLDKKKSMKK